MSMTNAAMFQPAWTPITIGLMVLGFVIYWPLGLAVLAYILWGDRLQGKFILNLKNRPQSEPGQNRHRYWQGENTGNAAFDNYRKSELERLEAERRKLEEERAEFETFLGNLRRAKDQEEFDRFMADRADTKAGRSPHRDPNTIDL